MTSRPPAVVNNASRHLDESWIDPQDDLPSFTFENQLADIPLEDLAGALTIKKDDRLSFPLLFAYSASTRRTSYRRGDAIADLPSGRMPRGSAWLEIDPRMSVRRAIDLYGQDLLAFEKVVRHVSLEIVVLPVRERREQMLRVLIRRPAIQAESPKDPMR